MGDRSDDFILAGSSPSYTQNPLELLHKQVSFVLLASILMIGLITFSLLNFVSSTFSWLSIIPVIGMFHIWASFKKKEIWALPYTIALYSLSLFLFGMLSFMFLGYAMMGDIYYMLMCVLLIFTTVATWKRLQVLRNPIFKTWYLGLGTPIVESELGDGEMLAYCPHCRSILAIKPELLNITDKCPHCSNNLVSDETSKMFEEDE